MWDEKFIFDKDQNKIKSEKISQKEFFYISTDFNFFGNPRNYGHLSNTNNEFNKNEIFEINNNIFFKLSDLSQGKRTHYFTTEYDKATGQIIEQFVNLNPNFGKIKSTKKNGSCKEVVIQKCESEKTLICIGKYVNLNKITKEIIKYNEEKKYFLCKKKKILSEHPFKDYQKIFPDQLDRNKYDEKESNYVVKLYNSEGFNYRHVKLDKKNLMIKETVDLPRINITYTGNCETKDNL